MKESIGNIDNISNDILSKMCDIGLDICKSRIDAAISLEKTCPSATEGYEKASKHFKNEEYELGFENIIDSFYKCDRIINGQNYHTREDNNTSNNINLPLIASILMLIVGIFFLLIVGLKQKR
jgi:hypothetical protein